MQKMSKVTNLIITALCISTCIVLPQAFHTIPNAGSIYLPMHIPVLLCGLLCGWSNGLLCGLIGPLLSSVLTGMPPAAYLPPMMVECAVYGCVTGLMMKGIRTTKITADVYISLVVAMVTGRILAGLVKAFIFMPGKFGLTMWVETSIITGLPGIAIQLIILPSIVLALIKARLVPVRYYN